MGFADTFERTPPPFTPKDLAERWTCSSDSILKKIREGVIPALRMGRIIRIPAKVVEDMEECRETTSHSDGTADSGSSSTQKTDDGKDPEQDSTQLRHIRT